MTIQLPHHHPLRPQLQVCNSRRVADARLQLIREPWGHYVILRTDADGRRLIGEADTFVLARALYRLLCSKEADRA